jgi:hypothetical protein
MTRSAVRRAVTSVLAVALLTVLVGCSQQQIAKGDTHVQHAAAKSEIEELYEKTLAIVGDGWKDGGREWRGCGRSALANTDSWARFSQRFGPLRSSPAELADEVAALWNRLGYQVEVVTDPIITPPRKVVSYPSYLTGTTAEGFGVVFTVGPDYADFRGRSRCVPSDPAFDETQLG